jgi:hypothetical protein
MTIYQPSKELYKCEVISTGEQVFFYITQDIAINNDHSINVKIAPFTSAGYTQNLGRLEYNITMTIMLTNTIDGTMEEKYNKLMKIKNTNQVIRLTMPNLPTGISNFQIKSSNQVLKEPARLMLSISLVEDLQSGLRIMSQNLIGSQAVNNIQQMLRDRGFI